MPRSERNRIRCAERRAELAKNGLCIKCAKRPASSTSLSTIFTNHRYSGKGAINKYCTECAILRSLQAKERVHKKWFTVLEAYGPDCACCGQKEPIFLTVDHINNDGHEDRRTNYRSSEQLYNILLKERRQDIQILCFNCNMAKARVGICPHKTPLERVM